MLIAPILGKAVDFGAMELTLQPRIEGGMLYYKYESEPIATSTVVTDATGATRTDIAFGQDGFKFSSVMPTLGGGLTLFSKRFFVDFSAQKAFNGDDEDTITTSISSPESSSTSVRNSFNRNTLGYNADFDRTEYGISAGYQITDQLIVFAGYKWADTDFNLEGSGQFSHTGDVEIQEAPPIIAVQPTVIEGTVKGKVNYKFEHDGPFVGAAHNWNIKKGFLNGSVSTTLAFAFLDGEVKADASQLDFTTKKINGMDPPTGNTGNFTTPNTAVFNSKGDTLGITFGLGWYGLTRVERLRYSVQLSGYSYSFDADKSQQPDIIETVVSLKAGVSYAF